MEQSQIWDRRFENTGAVNLSDAWVGNYCGLLEKIKPEPIIDLGCGKGENAVFLHQMGYSILACDFSQVALEKLQGLEPAIQTCCFDMTQELPVPGEAGAVVASLSTHYFPLEATTLLYKRIWERLRWGGVLLLRVNSLRELEENDRQDIDRQLEEDYYLLRDGVTKRYFSRESLTNLLRDFKIETLREDNCLYHGHRKYFLEAVASKSDNR